jgi:hypothetical protein
MQQQKETPSLTLSTVHLPDDLKKELRELKEREIWNDPAHSVAEHIQKLFKLLKDGGYMEDYNTTTPLSYLVYMAPKLVGMIYARYPYTIYIFDYESGMVYEGTSVDPVLDMITEHAEVGNWLGLQHFQ